MTLIRVMEGNKILVKKLIGGKKKEKFEMMLT